MESPKLSVIVAARNAANTIEQCMGSFLAQTYTNKELIVIDGASDDGTAEIVKRYSNDLAYWESTPDRGIYQAWNKALNHAGGEWLCFLGADDFFWTPTVLEKLGEKLPAARLEGINVVYGTVAIVDGNRQLIRYEGRPWPEAKKEIFRYMSVPHPGLMHHKSVFERHGKFDERFAIAGDYELLLRELKHGAALHVPDVISVGMRMGGLSTQKRYLLKVLREEAQARYRNHINPVNLHWLRCMMLTMANVGLARLLGMERFNRLNRLRRRIQPSRTPIKGQGC